MPLICCLRGPHPELDLGAGFTERVHEAVKGHRAAAAGRDGEFIGGAVTDGEEPVHVHPTAGGPCHPRVVPHFTPPVAAPASLARSGPIPATFTSSAPTRPEITSDGRHTPASRPARR